VTHTATVVTKMLLPHKNHVHRTTSSTEDLVMRYTGTQTAHSCADRTCMSLWTACSHAVDTSMHLAAWIIVPQVSVLRSLGDPNSGSALHTSRQLRTWPQDGHARLEHWRTMPAPAQHSTHCRVPIALVNYASLWCTWSTMPPGANSGFAPDPAASSRPFSCSMHTALLQQSREVDSPAGPGISTQSSSSETITTSSSIDKAMGTGVEAAGALATITHSSLCCGICVSITIQKLRATQSRKLHLH